MAYDEALAARVRDELAGRGDVAERRMFGGLAFLVDGVMAVAVSGQGGLMLRVPPERTEELLTTTAAEPMVMRGKELAGWARLPAAAVADEAELARWVSLGVESAASAPSR